MFFKNLIFTASQINDGDKPFVSYFAYGSNMDLGQLKSRVGNPQHWYATKLIGYKLVFNKFSITRNCGAGNLIPTNKPTDIVEGIVYSLSKRQINELDKYEGYRTITNRISKNPTGYKKIDVTLEDGRKSITYIANIEAGLGQARQLKKSKNINLAENMLKPSVGYLSHFLKGGELGISNDYLNLLAQTEVLEGGIYQDHVKDLQKAVIKI